MRKITIKYLVRRIKLPAMLILMLGACKENIGELRPPDNEGNGKGEIIVEREQLGLTALPIEYDYYDTRLTNDTLPPSNGCIFRGKISWNGASLMFIPKTNFVNDAYVSYIRVDDEPAVKGNPPYGNVESYSISGHWGKVYYSTSPYTIHIDIYKNDGLCQRKIYIRIGDIEFGEIRKNSEVHLIQE